MAELHILPGVERRDLLPEIPARTVLNKALDDDATKITIVGVARDGSFYLTSCCGNAYEMVGMLQRAITLVSGANLSSQDVIKTEDTNA
jgi:hypothetical protein